VLLCEVNLPDLLPEPLCPAKDIGGGILFFFHTPARGACSMKGDEFKSTLRRKERKKGNRKTEKDTQIVHTKPKTHS
jgi:hypothetical protein